jgi:hypothetical protein
MAYVATVTMSTPNLQSLASSKTAGWQSDAVDNTVNNYADYLVQVVLDFANTAPANDKAAYVFAYAGLDTVYTDPCTGAEGLITLPDITLNPLKLVRVGTIPYNVQDEVAESLVWSIAAVFGGIVPPKWGLVIIEYSGAALAASGNTVKYRAVA